MDQQQKDEMKKTLVEIQKQRDKVLSEGYFCEVYYRVCYNQITDWKVSGCGHKDLKKI